MAGLSHEKKGRKAPAPAGEADTGGFDFHGEPGHLIRRLHQIATSIFLEQCRELGVTPVQFAAISAIGRRPGLDQREIARLIATDRTTINLVSTKLEQRGWVRRVPSGRKVVLSLTADGQAALESLTELTRHHSSALLSPLTPSERDRFVTLMTKLVEGNNALSRVPVQHPADLPTSGAD
jgi:DNA-binding MarR family transcriptional regulator